MIRFNYYWRLFATALSFVTYGIGGLSLALLCPLFNLLPLPRQQKNLIARRFIHRCFRLFIWQMQTLGIFTYEVHGQEKLQNGQLVLANHPCFLDVVFLISFIPNANCIVKHSLFKNIFTQGPISAANYIPNIEGNQLVQDSVSSLKNGDSLIIFPEGTRTPVNGAVHLQRGAANIALSAGICPIMVTIKSSTPFLCKGVKWYDIPRERPHLCFTINQLGDISELSFDPKSARKLTDIFRKYFFPEEATHVTRK
jgi:1-acyl-sn-glycerol-3-phosphate acyltransferase